MGTVRNPYVRVLGIEVVEEGTGRAQMAVSPSEEEEFIRLSRRPDVYEVIGKSIAPSIFGAPDIKKAIACLLFGGSRKRLPDGMRVRGDINVLLLGDPGTAKSQVREYVGGV
jgi:DNA replication licensing factor MCM5